MTSFRKGVPTLFYDIPHLSPATQTPTTPTSSIPNNVFQTWMRRRFRRSMYQVWTSNKTNNPDFNFYVFNDRECRAFIAEEFDARTLAAYDALIPGAYKADLWRLCILYKRGGIYLDMKFKILGKLGDFTKTCGECRLVEELWQPIPDVRASYQAILISAPGHPLIARAITKLIENVEARYYGANDLDPTGPVMLGRILTPMDHTCMTLFIKSLQMDLIYEIHDGETTWFRQYADYRLDQAKDILLYGTQPHYRTCWKDRKIYLNVSETTLETPTIRP